MIEQQEIVQDVAYEVAVRIGPNQGWDRKVLTVSRDADGVGLHLLVEQASGPYEATTTLTPDEPLAAKLLRLQEVMATPTAPSWTTATLTVTASGAWPEPSFGIDADFTYPTG